MWSCRSPRGGPPIQRGSTRGHSRSHDRVKALSDFLRSASSALRAAGLEPHITEPGPELGIEVESPGRLYSVRVPSPGPYPMEVWVGLTVASPVVFGALREREEIVSSAL